MSIRTLIVLIGISAISMLLVSGCNKGGTVQTPQMLIEPGSQMGDIKKGMTVDQVIAKIGAPEARTATILEYKKLGFAAVASKDGVVRAVMCGSASGQGASSMAFTGRTKEGIGMGSTRDEVVKAFGNNFTLMPTIEPVPGRESLIYKDLGLTISLANGKVHHMIVDFRVPGR